MLFDAGAKEIYVIVVKVTGKADGASAYTDVGLETKDMSMENFADKVARLLTSITGHRYKAREEIQVLVWVVEEDGEKFLQAMKERFSWGKYTTHLETQPVSEEWRGGPEARKLLRETREISSWMHGRTFYGLQR